MTRAVLLLVAALLLAPLPAGAKKTKPQPCPGGRYLIAVGPLLPAATPVDVIVVGSTIALESGCAPIATQLKATRKGTVVRARWKSCSGIAGSARLVGTIAADCRTFTGRFLAKKAKLKKTVTGTLSSCGDGTVDSGAGEQCDGAAGCAAGATCTGACTCTPSGPNTAPTAAVAPLAPAPVFTWVAVDGTGSHDADGDPLLYAWDFGDGTRGTGATAVHAFVAPGTYTVRLTVGDGRGGVGTDETTVVVGAGPAPGPTVPAKGIVRSAVGTALAGVTVKLLGADTTATTDGQGAVTIPVPTGVPVRLLLSRNGYTRQVVTVNTPDGADSAYFESTMQVREPAQSIAAAAGGELSGKDGARLLLPANALVDENGAAIAGDVDVALTPVDPTTHPFAFPGDYAGVTPGGASGALVSYGTVEFALTAAGAPVNLAPGTAATVELPSYATVHPDGSPVAAGDAVALWTLDERTGTWIQEGSGTIVASANSPSGFALRATVSHFSWFNADHLPEMYRPKPKCLVDTNADGVLEDLTGTGHCWNAGTGPEQSGVFFGPTARARAGEAVYPQFAVHTMIPAAGGQVLGVPANVGIRWRATALDGLLASTKILRNGTEIPDGIVSGPADLEEEIVFVLEPVGAANATPITVPHDASHTLQTATPQQFKFTAAAGAAIGVAVERQSGSNPVGTVLVQGPGAVTFGPWTFGTTISGGGFVAPSAGEYRIVVNGTAGTYRLLVDNGSIFPLLVSSTIAANATGVALDAAVSFTFSRDLDPTKVHDGNFRVVGPAGPLYGEVVVSGPTVTFTPLDPTYLWSGMPLTVSALAYPPFRATNGIDLLADVVVPFRTADVPQKIAGIGQLGRFPTVAVRPDGRITVHSWSTQNPYGVWEATYTPGVGWSDRTQLDTRRQPEALAVNADGELLEIFASESTTLNFTNLLARRQVAGAAWGAPVAVENLSAGQASKSRGVVAVLDDDGNATAAWVEDTTNRLLVNRWPSGGAWGTPLEVSSSMSTAVGNVPLPSIAVNAAGTVALGWVDDGVANLKLYAPGSGWGATDTFVSGGGTVVDVRAGIDAAGNVIAVYNEGGAVRARRRAVGTGAWSAAVDLGTDSTDVASFVRAGRLSLAVAANGAAVMGGATLNSTTAYARYFVPDAGDGAWGAAVTIATQSTPFIRVVIDPAGNAIAAARANDATGLRWRRCSPAGAWDASSSAIARFADKFTEDWALAMGSGGQAVAVAVDDNPVSQVYFSGDVQAVRF